MYRFPFIFKNDKTIHKKMIWVYFEQNNNLSLIFYIGLDNAFTLFIESFGVLK